MPYTHSHLYPPCPQNALLFFFFNLFIYLWLCWVFVSVRGLSLVVASGGHSSSRCAGLSLSRPLLLWSTGSRRAGSVIVAHGPSCSAACGIFPDQGSNPCPLDWQADSQPLRHQGSPHFAFIHKTFSSNENILQTPVCKRGKSRGWLKCLLTRTLPAMSMLELDAAHRNTEGSKEHSLKAQET